jgi:oxygen-independent coproporphyrinogen III oxidase
VPVQEYLDGLRREFSRRESTNDGALDTVYLGGGTPSRLGADGIRDLLALIREFFTLEQGAEVTIEANPEDVTREAASAWHSAGVNRASLGIQSFDDEVLKWMHRTHDASQAAAAVQTLRESGINNVSVDLIFALPESLDRSWEGDLERALSLGPDHISLYGLTIEAATPIARWQSRGQVTAADEDRYAADFLLAHSLTGAAGYDHYEVSNFGRTGRNSRHNSAYWTGAAYIGAGPSAHSFDGEHRSWNVAPYAEWVARLMKEESAIGGREQLSDENKRAEKVYLGLRTSTGLRLSDDDLIVARRWKDAGWATIDGDLVRLTVEGWLRLDSLAAGLTGL